MRARVIIVATVILDAGLFGANAAIATWSGSRSVLAQAIFAITDLIASALLLWGLRISQRPADSRHPFGQGREIFVWAFLATLVTFLVAGIAAFVPGVVQVLRPAPIDHVGAVLVVLVATLVASVGGIWVTLREIRLARSTVRTLIDSAEQGLKTVFYQDIVMAAGCAVALVGLIIVGLTQWFWVDGVTASFEGALLVATGLALTVETRDYLVGRAMPSELRKVVLDLLERDRRVRRVVSVESTMLGPEETLLALRIEFSEQMPVGEIEAGISDLKEKLAGTCPSLRHIFIEPVASSAPLDVKLASLPAPGTGIGSAVP